jgi:Xaa-Pro aminopeptidase
MAEQDVAAPPVVGDGSPDRMGAVRHVSNARAWAGPMRAVLDRDDSDPWVFSHHGCQSCWAAVAADHAALRALLEGFDVDDLTPAFDALRRARSPFEIDALRENGALLSAAMEAFAAAARVGVP